MKSFPRWFLTLAFLLGSWTTRAGMTVEDVEKVISQAVSRAAGISPRSVVAVTDREGFVLGVWNVGPQPASIDDIANAIAKAGTAAFLSSDQHAFSSRTAGFIVQQNFPPGAINKAPGPLVGVNFSNLPFTDVNRFKGPPFGPNPQSGINGAVVPTPVTGGLAGSPGGVPLYKDGKLVGGVGVAGDGDGPTAIFPGQGFDVDEDVALAGQVGYAPSPVIFGSRVLIDGIRIPYVLGSASLTHVLPLAQLPGGVVQPYTFRASPPVIYPTMVLGGLLGEVRKPIQNDPLLDDADLSNNTIDGQPRLSAAEVTQILNAAARRASFTRAGIRLPRGQPAQVFISVVSHPNKPGGHPAILGTFRTPEATIFSWDVAVQKARTAIFFSSNLRAFSSRTVGFLAQSLFPPGILNTTPGPFLGLQEKFSTFPQNVTNPLNGALVTSPPEINPNLPNGITIFPGGFPLYRNGVLIGAIGVSGDGIDQDDLIGAAGAALFPAPLSIRADHFSYFGARLPYAKFPRNPSL
ncbi:MAG: heme-binding protein [Pedosphaera sp.]|nr:heme-binding protein [Pedosphaera sp.]